MLGDCHLTSEARAWVYGGHVPDPTSRDLLGLKAKSIAQRIAKRLPKRVLRYGCGEGNHPHLIKYLQPDAACVGVDEQSLHSGKDFEFYRIRPIGLLPFDASSFDVVVSVDVLEHVQSIEHSLNEIPRALRPGGAFKGCVPLEEGFSHQTLFRPLSPNPYRDTKNHVPNLTKRETLGSLSALFRIVLACMCHSLGACMDTAFSASFQLPVVGKKIDSLWRAPQNVFHHRSGDQQGLSRSNQLNRLCSTLAYYEATILQNVSVGACGLHFHAEKAV